MSQQIDQNPDQQTDQQGPKPNPILNPVTAIRAWLNTVTLGQATMPLAILFMIYFFDEFDTAAFGVLAPEIKRAFDLSDQAFVGIIAANLNIVLLCAIPLGYY